MGEFKSDLAGLNWSRFNVNLDQFKPARSLGEREILKNINGLLVGRPKAWKFNNQQSDEMKIKYKENQRKTILDIVRTYNRDIPIVQNMDFGHTAPQICLPFGRKIKIDVNNRKIFAHF
ncbi:MAG: hypothetical protein IPM97_01525 [Bdellovibrionaceae bacterium]|nr:hypothetical protein [Pseudobdellovibrionaceae bacterium]